jgi:hypothetical protein
MPLQRTSRGQKVPKRMLSWWRWVAVASLVVASVTAGPALAGGAVLLGASAGYFAGDPLSPLPFGDAQNLMVPSPSYTGHPAGIVATPSGHGYWIDSSNGGVFTFGDAGFYGSMGATVLNAPIVGMAATPDGGGYWLVAADGGIFAFGNATFEGSMGATRLNAPIVGMAATPSGGGYWLVAADGGVFSFGDAGFQGSMGSSHLNAPIVGMAAASSGHGYWMVGADGGVFSFGDTAFEGSMGATHLNAPIVGMAGAPSGNGYWMVGSDGGVFNFGDAVFHGSMGGIGTSFPIGSMAVTRDGGGYWLLPAPLTRPADATPGVINDCNLALPEGAASQIEPTSISFACADGGSGVQDLVWTSWTESSATGTGVIWQNHCIPDCAAGTFGYYPASITLSDVQQTVVGPLFAQLTAVFDHLGPEGQTSSEIPLPPPPL